MGIEDYLQNIEACANSLEDQKEFIKDVVKVLKDARKENKQVFIIGNGGSAGTATHMAADLFKIGELKAISLCDNVPLMTAIINDSGWENLFIDQLERLYVPGDILISISVHGCSGEDKAGIWSQNIMKAIEYVKRNGGKTIGFSGFQGGAMEKECDISIVIPACSTPIIESFHIVLEHFITFELQKGNRK